MILSLEINGKTVSIDSRAGIDLSIPLDFNGEQPNSYDVTAASSKPCESEGLIGDTRRGGSCNFEEYHLIPHCNGTHTECIGHTTKERLAITDVLKDVIMSAILITVEPENAVESGESYPCELDESDRMITLSQLEKIFDPPATAGGTDSLSRSADTPVRMSAKARKDGAPGSALIIRTLPNDDSKKTRRYMQNPPPFFSNEAMEYIVELGVKHLLVDLPSIDRMFDEGKLSNHRVFWKMDQWSFELKEDSRINSTITEMIYVPNEIKDGEYILNLQIAPFKTDAAPSRPIIFPINK